MEAVIVKLQRVPPANANYVAGVELLVVFVCGAEEEHLPSAECLTL